MMFLMSFNLSLVKYLNDTSIIVPLTLGKFAERLVIVIGNFDDEQQHNEQHLNWQGLYQ